MDSKATLAELVGTFILVFIGTATAVVASLGLLGSGGTAIIAIAFAFGFTLLALVYAIGPVSGCHLNPAVTIAMLLAGKIKSGKAFAYIVAQIAGGVLASLVLLVLVGGLTDYDRLTHGLGANGIPSSITSLGTLGFEIVMTALFLFVIFHATSAKASPAGAGLAIGGYLFVIHLIGAPLGGASLNPARSIGPALIQGDGAIGSLWVFIVGPLIGGLIGLLLYNLTRPKEE
jgi:aquaporin Z